MEFLGSAGEKSSAKLQVTFTDIATGLAVTPKSATWTLMKSDGTVVNGRTSVAISPLSSTSNIILKGDDLALSDPADLVRIILVEAVYDSALENDIPIKKVGQFKIADLLGVS